MFALRAICNALVGHGTEPLSGGPGPWDPLSNRACRFPAHGLPMIFGMYRRFTGEGR